MKNKLLTIILNQYIISAIISLAIIYFLPNYFSKYKIELQESNILPRVGSLVYYEDLNNDFISEKIIFYKNNTGNASYEIQNSKGGIINQWNLSEEPNKGNSKLFFLDIDNNGFKEIAIFTQKQDSIFLNITEPFVKKGIKKNKIFIDVVGKYNNEYKSKVYSLILGIKKLDGIHEIYFTLNTGFGGKTRNAYKYNYTTNKVTKSPHLTNTLSINNLIDINGDKFEEILFNGYANGNEIDSVYTTRSDYSSWLTVLDTNLNFLFNPVEINIPFSSVYTLPFKLNNEYKLLCLIDSRGNSSTKDKIGVYSVKGVLEKTIIIPTGYYPTFLRYKKNKVLLYNLDNGNVVIFNNKFQIVSNFYIEKKWLLRFINIDLDEEQEWVSISKNNQSISIFREDFTHPISFEIPNGSFEHLHYGVIHNKKIENGIFFQRGNNYFVYSYFKNPYYSFRFLIYLGVFFIIFGIVWLIAKGQKIRLEKKLSIENEIAQLQIKTIKNQVDPHFVFNAINTMSEMMLINDKLAADDFICKFSDLMRKTLKGSDKISHTLKEELDYVENFIQLQQIRFNNSFSYKFSIDKRVNVENIVPKHVLYCYVENAIKHGLSKINNGGVLKIDAIESDKRLKLTIENNGGGIEGAKKYKKNSTGNGILIMEKIYDLYFKLYRKKITYKLIEVKTKLGLNDGVKIEILISK